MIGSIIAVIIIAAFFLVFILWARKEVRDMEKNKYKKTKEQKSMDKFKKIIK